MEMKAKRLSWKQQRQVSPRLETGNGGGCGKWTREVEGGVEAGSGGGNKSAQAAQKLISYEEVVMSFRRCFDVIE